MTTVLGPDGQAVWLWPDDKSDSEVDVQSKDPMRPESACLVSESFGKLDNQKSSRV